MISSQPTISINYPLAYNSQIYFFCLDLSQFYKQKSINLVDPFTSFKLLKPLLLHFDFNLNILEQSSH